MGMGNTLKGKFRPKNPEKYKGDPGNIIFRSSWELDWMKRCDENPYIVWWQSEEKCYWYFDAVSKRNRRYFPDFIVGIQRDYGIETLVIEIKPQKQIDGPNPNPKRRTKAWVNSVKTYMTNQCKWKAMEKVCEERGWNFKLLSERNVPGWAKRK